MSSSPYPTLQYPCERFLLTTYARDPKPTELVYTLLHLIYFFLDPRRGSLMGTTKARPTRANTIQLRKAARTEAS